MVNSNNDWQVRTRLLLGNERVEELANTHVLVAGLGGVGAYAAEMLCRAGVGTLTIVDADVIATGNRNRQLLALSSTEGRSKAELMAQRLLDINPELRLHVHHIYLKDELIDELLVAAKYSYVIDAIDTLAPKVRLIQSCLANGIPIVSSMGAGAKLDPTKIEISDISKSHHCPLAHMLRKRLHKLGIRKGVKVVFSSEGPMADAIELCENEPNKKSTVGTISYMPAVFGCYCASVVVTDLIR